MQFHKNALKVIFLLSMILVTLVEGIKPQTVFNETTTTESNLNIESSIIFPTSKIEVRVSRIIETNNYLYTWLNDTIEILNKNASAFNGFIIYFPKEIWDKITHISVFGKLLNENKTKLEWNYYISTKDFLAISIDLKTFVKPDETYIIYLHAEVPNLVRMSKSETSLFFSYDFPQKVLIPYNVTSMTIEFLSPKGSSLIDNEIYPSNGSISGNSLTYDLVNVSAFNDSVSVSSIVWTHFAWTMNEIPLGVPFVERTIRVRLDGTVEISDHIKLEAKAPEFIGSMTATPWKTNNFTIGLAKDAKKISVKDEFGDLEWASETNNFGTENITIIRISFRVPIIAKTTVDIYVHFVISGESQNGYFDAEFPLAPKINATIGTFILKIEGGERNIIINGPEILNNQVKSYKLVGIGLSKKEVISIIVSNLYPSWNEEINMRYLFTLNYYLSTWLLIFIIVLPLTSSALLLALYLSKKEEILYVPEIIEKTKIRENILKYIKQYEAYIALDAQLEQFVRTKILTKRPTRGALEQLNKRIRNLRSLRDSLYEISDRLEKEPELSNITNNLNEIETRVELSRERLLNEIQRFLRGKIKRAVFIKRCKDILKVIKEDSERRRRYINRLKDILMVRYGGK